MTAPAINSGGGSNPRANRFWQYYGFETGQHIALYQARTLARLAQELGAQYLRLEGDLHLITRKILPAETRWILQHRRLNRFLWRFARRRYRSRTVPDFEALQREASRRAIK